MTDESMTFEKALAELEQAVARLEEGSLPLDETLNLFERGQTLVNRCNELLNTAELRLEKLTVNADGELAVSSMEDNEA